MCAMKPAQNTLTNPWSPIHTTSPLYLSSDFIGLSNEEAHTHQSASCGFRHHFPKPHSLFEFRACHSAHKFCKFMFNLLNRLNAFHLENVVTGP